MRLSLEQLSAFSAIAAERSFSSAARKLGKTQSALSIAIANLEIDLGVILFDRSQRVLQLTSEGRALLRDAETILTHCFTMENRASALANQLEAELVISIDEAIPDRSVAPILQRFSQVFPHTDLQILNLTGHRALEMLENQRLLLSVNCTQPHYPMNLQFKRLGSINFCNVAHREHPLATMFPVSFNQLSQYRQIIYLPFQDKLPTSEYLLSPNHWRVESCLTLMNMLREGMGWATVPETLIRQLDPDNHLTELQLEAYPFTEWSTGVDMVWSSLLRTGPAGSWLRQEFGQTPVAAS